MQIQSNRHLRFVSKCAVGTAASLRVQCTTNSLRHGLLGIRRKFPSGHARGGHKKKTGQRHRTSIRRSICVFVRLCIQRERKSGTTQAPAEIELIPESSLLCFHAPPEQICFRNFRFLFLCRRSVCALACPSVFPIRSSVHPSVHVLNKVAAKLCGNERFRGIGRSPRFPMRVA